MAPPGVGGSSVRHWRAHQGWVPRVELAAVCHGPPHASGAGYTVPATHRGGAGRDHPSRPPHGARTPRAGRPGRDRAEDRTKNVTLNRNHPIDLEGLRPREPRPGDLPDLRAAARRRRQGPDLPALPHGRLGRCPGPAIWPDPLEHLSHPHRDAGQADPRHQARVHRPRELPRGEERTPRSSPRSPSRPTARRLGAPRRPRACPPTWPASTRSRSWTAARRCTCSAR